MALHISWDNESSSVFVDLVVAQTQDGAGWGEFWAAFGAQHPYVSAAGNQRAHTGQNMLAGKLT